MPKVVELTETIKAGKAGERSFEGFLIANRENFNTAKGGGYAGIATGIEELDKTLGGLQTGLHILAAQPGAGKTALALNIVRHCSRQGYPVVYASFDEVPERLLIKIIAAETGLDVGKLFGVLPIRKSLLMPLTTMVTANSIILVLSLPVWV